MWRILVKLYSSTTNDVAWFLLGNNGGNDNRPVIINTGSQYDRMKIWRVLNEDYVITITCTGV